MSENSKRILTILKPHQKKKKPAPQRKVALFFWLVKFQQKMKFKFQNFQNKILQKIAR
jgi:hypothetical protein